MKKVLSLAIIATLVTGILISAVSCSEFGIGQDIEAEIFMFEARREPPDISKVVFHVLLERTERTVNGADYSVSLKLDGKVFDSKTISVSKSGSMEGVVTLTANGREMNRMLSDLDGKYDQAKSDYEDFQNEVGWDFFRGQLGTKSYDEIKRLQEKETKLKTEVNKWKSLRNGEGVIYGGYNSLVVFCRKYVTITITRQQD